MTQNWHLRYQDKTLGPFSSEQVLQMFTHKLIPQDALMCKEGSDQWVSILASLSELKPAPQAQDVPSVKEPTPESEVPFQMDLGTDPVDTFQSPTYTSFQTPNGETSVQTPTEVTAIQTPLKDGKKEQRKGKRVEVKGSIVIHNRGDILFASGVNISSSGILVHSTENIFKLNEIVQLTCRVEGLKPFNVKALVSRIDRSHPESIEYGLSFTEKIPDFEKELNLLHKEKNRDS